MTAIEEYVTKVAAALAKDPEHDPGCQWLTGSLDSCNCGYVPSTLEQRIAIGLVEARAIECRYWSTKLLSKFLGEVWAVWLSKHLDERARKLGVVGLSMCKTWPPNTPAATLVETGGLGDLQ